MKHESFALESEWRIHGQIAATDNRRNFRSSGPYIRPYVELDLYLGGDSIPKGAITEVVISPGLNIEVASNSLYDLFTVNNVPLDTVRASVSPYRS